MFLLTCAVSFFLSLTFLPRSTTIGRIPNSISRSAANKPAGPQPTTIAWGASDIFLYFIPSNLDSGSLSSIYILSVKLTKTLRCRASIDRFTILTAFISEICMSY